MPTSLTTQGRLEAAEKEQRALAVVVANASEKSEAQLGVIQEAQAALSKVGGRCCLLGLFGSLCGHQSEP